MPILQRALEEPLLSRQQVAIIRDIARAAQISEALKLLTIITESLISTDLPSEKAKQMSSDIEKYLRAEATRVLMQIKIPATHDKSSNAPTTAPGKGE